MGYGKNKVLHPKDYFVNGFFDNNCIKPELLEKFAKAAANVLLKDRVPLSLLENLYGLLVMLFNQEKELNQFEDLTDIMRAKVLSEPYIKHPFLIELIDSGLLTADDEKDIKAFFAHFNKIINLCQYGKLEGVYEF